MFLGKRLHKFNASAQYAAPLMADFNAHDTTSIRYVDTGVLYLLFTLYQNDLLIVTNGVRLPASLCAVVIAFFGEELYRV